LIFEHHSDIKISESNIFKIHDDMLAHGEKDTRPKGNYKFNSNRVEEKIKMGTLLALFLIQHLHIWLKKKCKH